MTVPYPAFTNFRGTTIIFISKHIAKQLVAVLATTAWLVFLAAEVGAEIPVMAYYECLWWSPSQMVDLDPNKPPPKTARVVLKKWEYSDPIGVPHPDEVYLVVEIPSGLGDRHVVQAMTRWRTLTGWTRWTNRTLEGPSMVGGSLKWTALLYIGHDIRNLSPTLLQSEIQLDKNFHTRVNLPFQLGD